jgi:hypothetical protein
LLAPSVSTSKSTILRVSPLLSTRNGGYIIQPFSLRQATDILDCVYFAHCEMERKSSSLAPACSYVLFAAANFQLDGPQSPVAFQSISFPRAGVCSAIECVIECGEGEGKGEPVVRIGEDFELFQVYVQYGSEVFRGDCGRRRVKILVTMCLCLAGNPPGARL